MQVTVLVPVQAAWVEVTETKFTFAGKVSVIVIVPEGPKLLLVIVMV